jgi:hypothetical protein
LPLPKDEQRIDDHTNEHRCNRQSASREVYKTRDEGSFVAFTFVDGVMTELDNLGADARGCIL